MPLPTYQLQMDVALACLPADMVPKQSCNVNIQLKQPLTTECTSHCDKLLKSTCHIKWKWTVFDGSLKPRSQPCKAVTCSCGPVMYKIPKNNRNISLEL